MADDVVLIAGLAILAVWALLGVLAIALFVVLKVLQSIRGWLERIAMGVRAIEKETEPLPSELRALASHGAAPGRG